jgi:hypothetical protein
MFAGRMCATQRLSASSSEIPQQCN